MAGITLKGRTDTLGPRNLDESFQRFNVDQEGEFNVTLSTPLSSFAIRNSRNELVAFDTNALAPQTGCVRLAPGTYTALISEQVSDARDWAFSLSFTPVRMRPSQRRAAPCREPWMHPGRACRCRTTRCISAPAGGSTSASTC